MGDSRCNARWCVMLTERTEKEAEEGGGGGGGGRGGGDEK